MEDSMIKKPELLLPAGSLAKTGTALQYGADAVYMGGKQYSLRARAGNLEMSELQAAILRVHERQGRVYVTVNIFAHNADLSMLPDYLSALRDLGADGFIISDLGVLRLARRYAPEVPVTISTQANTTNYEAALLYAELGVKRIVLARELNLEEIRRIKEKSGLEIEIFVHGAMCVSYSGRCWLSYYMTGRNANRGECAQPCRYQYYRREESRPGLAYAVEEDERGAYVMNAKDLCLLEAVPELIAAGVDAFKVEGRMKNQLYLSSVGSVYRQAIDICRETPAAFAKLLPSWREELDKTATRPFTSGFIYGYDPQMQDVLKETESQRVEFAGIVTGYDQDKGRVVVEQRFNFGPGDEVEFFLPGLTRKAFTLAAIWDEKGQPLDRARHPQQPILIDWPEPLAIGSILRKKVARQ
jgi:putative protease